MCIYNKPVTGSVENTKIFVSKVRFGGKRKSPKQVTIYQNEVVTKVEENQAMILPFVGSNCELVDMSNYDDFFEKLGKLFINPLTRAKEMKIYKDIPLCMGSFLPVQSVGSYKCSVAKNLNDLLRIDPSVFQVEDNIRDLLKEHYPHGFGFLICKLTKSGEQHPLAYITDIQNETLFVPTRHDHGDASFWSWLGVTSNDPSWDHEIYYLLTCDVADLRTGDETFFSWLGSCSPFTELKSEISWEGGSPVFSTLSKKCGVRVVAQLPQHFYVRRQTIKGRLKNQDIFLHPNV